MAARDELQPLFLLSDEPIDGHAGDFLSREDDARMIAGAVLGTAGPFSVGIYGEWGTGKTSLLHHVKSLLEAPESPESLRLRYPYLVTVFFNAWQHERDAAPLAHLAEAVDAAITKRLQDVGTVAGKASERAVGWLRSAHLAARSLVYGASVELKATADSPGFKLSGKDAIDQYAKLQAEAADPSSKAWKAHVDQSVTRSVLRSFRADHTQLDKVRPGEEKRVPRVVVFIDDMDRCLPEDAFTLLQAIKLALAQPGFVFVMTLDPSALQPFLDTKVGAAGHNAGAGSKVIYLDKLVQLPYPLRLHDDQFARFVDKIVRVRLKEMLVAPKDFDRVESDPSLAPQWQVFMQLARVLELSSQKNPRTLIRRINGLLVDARVASPAIKAALDKDPAKADGAFMGLCLIRHTLKHFLGDAITAQLSAAPELCGLIAVRGLADCAARAADLASGRVDLAQRTSDPAAPTAGHAPGDMEIQRHRDLIRELARVRCLDALFKTDVGQRWLKTPDERELVETFYAKRPEGTLASPAATLPTPQARDSAADGMDKIATTPGPGPRHTSREQAWMDARIESTTKEQSIIERAIRGSLDLPADAPVGPAEFARVTTLDLGSDPITDAGVAWLARHESGLTALTSLNLSGTRVTDAGVKELARAQTGLKVLTTLSLADTQVTDAGVKELVRGETGLKALTNLDLGSTQVTDAGVKELARAEMGLRALTALRLARTLATDAGVKALARAETDLKALTLLNLAGTQVTDAGVKELARADTGLKALVSLNLAGTQVTDAGVKELVRSGTGLKALTWLNLAGTQVTDEGVKELARAETGLMALATLSLAATRVTDAAARAVKARFPGINIER